jgi:hypothetical protein
MPISPSADQDFAFKTKSRAQTCSGKRGEEGRRGEGEGEERRRIVLEATDDESRR